MGTRYSFKVCMLGDGGVGKTSLKNRYVHGQFTDKYLTTLGVDFASHLVKLDSKTEVSLQIWDVAGQELFSSLRNSYFQGAKGALIVYDVTRPETLENLLESWISPFFKALDERPPIILIANKADLQEERVLKEAPGRRLIEKLKEEFSLGYDIPHIETSAKEGSGLECFEIITKSIIQYMENKED